MKTMNKQQEEEIREKFYNFANPKTGAEQSEGIDQFYPGKYNKEIADFWLNEIELQRKELIGEVGKMKVRERETGMLDSQVPVHNRAIEKVLQILTQE